MDEKELIKGSYTFKMNVAKFALVFGLVAVVGLIRMMNDNEFIFYLGLCMFLFGALLSIGSIILYVYCNNTMIVVTDKRVYGKVIGKQVDLPIDSISAVLTTWFKGVGVATASGRITFWGVDNRDEIYRTIRDLLNSRQTSTKSNMSGNQSSDADEIKKYKDLLDAGVITQEEFEIKKKQLLGL